MAVAKYTDGQLLETMRKYPGATYEKLAKILGASQVSVHNRLDKLIRNGVFKNEVQRYCVKNVHKYLLLFEQLAEKQGKGAGLAIQRLLEMAGVYIQRQEVDNKGTQRIEIVVSRLDVPKMNAQLTGTKEVKTIPGVEVKIDKKNTSVDSNDVEEGSGTPCDNT